MALSRIHNWQKGICQPGPSVLELKWPEKPKQPNHSFSMEKAANSPNSEVAKKEDALTDAEAALSRLKPNTSVKLGAVPFIAGKSNKASAFK